MARKPRTRSPQSNGALPVQVGEIAMALVEDHLTTRRHKAYVILEGGRTGGMIGHVVEAVLITLIVGNVLAYTLQSIPSVDAQFSRFFTILEWVSVAIFTIEYVIR